MAIGELLLGAWSKTRRYLEVLDQAIDYDPLEEQRCWIASLEERIKRIEAGLPPPSSDPPPLRPLPHPKMRRLADNTDPLVTAEKILATKWTLPILRALGDGPSRFTGLRAAISAVSANILAGRLRDLEEVGIIRRETLPPPAQCQVYALTDLGKAAEPIMLAIDQWASHFPRQRAPRRKSQNLLQEEKDV